MNRKAEVTFSDAKKSLSEQEVKDLRLVFDVFDADSNGYIDRYELKRAMRSLGFKVTAKTLEVHPYYTLVTKYPLQDSL